MIAWTTPTLPVRLNTGLLESTKCEVYGTFSQNGRALTIKPFYIHSDPETDRTYLKFNLSQLQSGGFKPGAVSFQVNFIDWMGYRAATKIEPLYIGSNLLGKELHNGRNIHGYQPGYGNVAAV